MNMSHLDALIESIHAKLGRYLISLSTEFDELTIVVDAKAILKVCESLKGEFSFEQLIDIAGVDYSAYGLDEWRTEEATSTGFSRGVHALASEKMDLEGEQRFAVVYHILSVSHNQRLRVKTFLPAKNPIVESVISIWPNAEWQEREAFDLFGILFKGHPDLRRILTDYGFVGHPFRKDFPLIGTVEMRYDADKGRVVYEPVEIESRILAPRVIRHDNRFGPEKSAHVPGEEK